MPLTYLLMYLATMGILWLRRTFNVEARKERRGPSDFCVYACKTQAGSEMSGYYSLIKMSGNMHVSQVV